jgi:hypothetical protein
VQVQRVAARQPVQRGQVLLGNGLAVGAQKRRRLGDVEPAQWHHRGLTVELPHRPQRVGAVRHGVRRGVAGGDQEDERQPGE